MTTNRFHHPTFRAAAITFAIVLPTIVTWVYFHLLGEHPMQKAAYSIGKAIQFAFPLIWICLLLRQRIREGGLPQADSTPDVTSQAAWSQRQSITFGIAMGVAVAAAMFGIYKVIPANVLSELSAEVGQRIQTLGLASPTLFVGLAVFYALLHSFMEEYYFRWFIFGQSRYVMRFVPAMLLCGFAFMAHHVIVLAMYFGWTPLTAFLSFSIAVGGMIWAWQYERSGSLLGPWISHMIVDAGIFAIGYDVLQKSGAF